MHILVWTLNNYQNLGKQIIKKLFPGFFSLGKIPFLVWGGACKNIFLKGRDARNNISSPQKKHFLPLGHNKQEGEEYLILTFWRLPLILCPKWDLILSGAETYYFKFHQRRLPLCPKWDLFPSGAETYYFKFYSSWAYAPYAPRLDTPLIYTFK